MNLLINSVNLPQQARRADTLESLWTRITPRLPLRGTRVKEKYHVFTEPVLSEAEAFSRLLQSGILRRLRLLKDDKMAPHCHSERLRCHSERSEESRFSVIQGEILRHLVPQNDKIALHRHSEQKDDKPAFLVILNAVKTWYFSLTLVPRRVISGLYKARSFVSLQGTCQASGSSSQG